jgi:predicted lipoprotein with Yx(FWY)xxD motif
LFSHLDRAGKEVGMKPKIVLHGLVAVTAAAVVAGNASATGVTTGTARNATKNPAKHVVVSTRKLPKLGVVLVDAKGRTLYMFVPDKRKKVTCVATCAAVWPPVKLAKGAKPTAKGKTKAKLLGSDPDPAGGRVVTYHGWPLYGYVGDTSAGQAKGQALDLNGGLWYVVSPSGKVIEKKA